LTRAGTLLASLALFALGPAVDASPAAPADFAARVLELVNAARAEPRRCGWKRFAAAPPLTRSAMLEAVAREHAEDMAWRGRMEHAGGDGSTPAGRATRIGYRWLRIAENVAAGQATPEAAVASWLEIAGHCANLMDPAYTETGVGVATAAAGQDGPGWPYWAQIFGMPAPQRRVRGFAGCTPYFASSMSTASRRYAASGTRVSSLSARSASCCARSKYTPVNTRLSRSFFWGTRGCYWADGNGASACRACAFA
jgi:uncharacterized protein YkwD